MSNSTSIYEINIDTAKLAGAILTVFGIAMASGVTLYFVHFVFSERIAIVGLTIWLIWFFLREGLPPFRIVISDKDRQIGLQNSLLTRWYPIQAGEFAIIEKNEYQLRIDNRTIYMPTNAGQHILNLRIEKKVL